MIVSDLKCDSNVFHNIPEKFNGLNGYSGEILEAKFNVVKEKQALTNDSDIQKEKSKNQLAFIEISIIIHRIYI